MLSKITGNQTRKLFTTTVLGKYEVDYYQCLDTGFIQTEEPYWLEEAYSSALSALDVGSVSRSLFFADELVRIIANGFKVDGKFLDFGGGSGLLVRLMRDRGVDFYRQDRYAANSFARCFDLSDLSPGTTFELATAFEVVEHLPDPVAGLEEILSYTDSVLFSTELQPKGLRSVDDWWYFVPVTGQHVSLYTQSALEFLASRFGLRLYTNSVNLHLLSRKQLGRDPFRWERGTVWERLVRRIHRATRPRPLLARESLVSRDFVEVEARLKS